MVTRAVIPESSESATRAESRQTTVPFVDMSSCPTINRACAHANKGALYIARTALNRSRRFARVAKNVTAAVTSKIATIADHHGARMTKDATCTIVKGVRITLVKSVVAEMNAIIDVSRRNKSIVFQQGEWEQKTRVIVSATVLPRPSLNSNLTKGSGSSIISLSRFLVTYSSLTSSGKCAHQTEVLYKVLPPTIFWNQGSTASFIAR